MLPASAVPVIVGVGSLVVVAEMVNDEGALGAVVSITKLLLPEKLELPTAGRVKFALIPAESLNESLFLNS